MNRRICHTISLIPAMLVAGVALTSCIYEDDNAPEEQSGGTIRVNTRADDGAKTADGTDNTFMLLFWSDRQHLLNPTSSVVWPSPYLAAHAPQPVSFYEHSVYDTNYPYPDEDTPLYATGFAPGGVLHPDITEGYRILTSNAGQIQKGRYDFLGCDEWCDVYKGSLADPFAQNKNKLYFRHLAAKLVFYADRDKETMENKQFVRNVTVTNLHMSIDGGNTWTAMHTPSCFRWEGLTAKDKSTSYNKAIEVAKLLSGNSGVTSSPTAGYRTYDTESFAGDDTGFIISRRATNRVPIEGMVLDSCYVCNKTENGVASVPTAGNHIQLKMDISAELSFRHDFPLTDDKGNTTDDLTFTRVWKDVRLDAIYQVDKDGNVTTAKISEFLPGNEYRIYITFFRTGVNLAALELPWNIGGVHYVTIPGGKR